MDSTSLLIDLIGAAALLLWGLRLLNSGVNTSFGGQLRHFLSASTRNRFSAFGAGLTVTLALQSSTAMAVLVSSFVAQGFIVPMMAQAVMLGANVGTALVAQALSFNVHWLAPVAILIGVGFASGKSRRNRGFSEIAIGIGLMLLSLRLMSEATQPMQQSQAVALFFGMLGNAPVIAIILSAVLAALSASSLAVVLFIMSLATAGVIDAELCLLLVAGANVGGALPPVLAASADAVAGRRVVVSNLAVRSIGALMLLLAAPQIVEALPAGINIPQFAVQSHLAFNIALAIVFLPFIGPITHILTKLIPDVLSTCETAGPRHLDEGALNDPPSALAAAMRETLHVGDLVETMLDTTLTALKSNDEQLCQKVFQLDDEVDEIEEAIKLYLSRIKTEKLDKSALQQVDSILHYAMNLEHIGDIIDRSLSRLTIKKIDNHLQYSPEGMREIEELFHDTIDNLQLAQNVFLNRDARSAHRLMQGKVTIRHKERASIKRHLARLQDRHSDTLKTTSLHVDVVRDLKRINSHLMSVATPILEEAGMLRESRLRKI